MYLDVLICWPRIVIVEVNVVALACCRSIGSFVGCDLFRCAVYPAQCLKDRAATEQTTHDIEKLHPRPRKLTSQLLSQYKLLNL